MSVEKMILVMLSCICMSPILLSLQKRISFTLLQKIEHDEISIERASEIAKKVLGIIPNTLLDDQIESAIIQLDNIPELNGIAFGMS